MTAAPTPTPVGYAADRWSALGTYVQLVVAGPDALRDARREAETLLDEVDRAYSRFRPDSDLVRANASAGSWVRVSLLLVSALQAALDAARETDGLVDPTVGGSLEALGYDRDLAELQAGDGPAGVPVPVPLRAWQEVGVDPAGAVRVPRGVVVDLGAVGKAFAADLLAARLASRVGVDCVVSLGGDVAIGSIQDGGRHGWRVEIAEGVSDAPAQVVTLDRGGLATSTTTQRRWRRGGRTVHHVLDPRTGRPVEGEWRTASVAAADCVAANTASTAALVLGDQAVPALEARGLPARLVAQDGTVRTVGGWPGEAA
ncbi:MAG TPA: FAD:protein FMN transferase [Kineosporiaceae bacterium]|nr:FAD:protein FMN transferase [Kineosporiaceae bacterium]